MTTQSQKSIKVDTTKFITLESKANALKFQIYHNFNPYPYPHKIDTHFPYFLNSYANFVKTQNCSLLEFYRKSIVEKGYKHSDTVKCKNKISCITTSVILKEKTNRTKANIERYLPLYFLDIDPKNSIKEGLTHDFTKNIDLLKEKLKLCPYVKIMHKSVSNFGLVCVFQFPPDSTVAEHYGRCLAVNKYVIDFLKNDDVFTNNFEIDTTGTDIVRLRFLSYDTDLTFNPKAEIFSDKLDIVEVEKVKKEYDNLDNEKYNVADIIHIHCPNLRISNDKIIRIDDGSKAGTYNEKDNTVYFYTPNRIDGFEQKKLYNAFMVCRLFNIPFEQKKKKQNETKVFTVNKYLSEQFEQIKDEALKYKNVIITAPTNAGKTTFFKKFVKHFTQYEKIIFALPRINNINEQIHEFEGFEAIHSEKDNFDKVLVSDYILCCHASLPKILRNISDKSKTIVIIDEFQDFCNNVKDCFDFENFLQNIKKDNINTIFVSATITDSHIAIYSKYVIKIDVLEKQKTVLNIVYNNPKNGQKEFSKQNFMLQFVAKNKKEGFVSTVFVEDKTKLSDYAKILQLKGYKVLTLDANTKNKKDVINTITSKEIEFFDVLLHTSSLKAGMNIIHDKVRMLALDTFFVKDNRKCLNIVDIIQLAGRMRQGIKDITVYVDFEVSKGKTLEYSKFAESLCLDSISLEHIEQTQQKAFTGLDVFVTLHEKKAFVSTKKVLLEYEHQTNIFTSIEDLKNAFAGAEITESNFEFVESEKVIKVQHDITKKEYKERILGLLNGTDKDALITAFVDAKILDKKDFHYLPTTSESMELKYLVEHEYAKQESTKRIFTDYQFFINFYKDSQTVAKLMQSNNEKIKLVKQRIKANDRQKEFRKVGTDEKTNLTDKEIKYYARCKEFAKTIKNKFEYVGSISKEDLIEISSTIPTIYEKAYRLKYFEILNILNVFYNVECSHKNVHGLACINSKNEYYYALE